MPPTPPYAAPAATSGHTPPPPPGYPGGAPAAGYGPAGAPPAPGFAAPSGAQAAPGYPAPGPAAPGYPAPGQPGTGYARPKDTRPKLLAILGLVAGIVGVVLAFIPFVTLFSWLFLLAGLVLGIIALVSKRQGGTGLAIGAVATSGVGVLVAIVMSFLSFLVIGVASSVAEEAGRDPGITEESEEAPLATDAEEIAVVETAFGRETYDDQSWWYVIVLDNPNADYVFDFAPIEIEALSADGTILDTSTEYLTLLPGTVAVTGGFFEVGSTEIASLEVRGPSAADAIESPADETGAFVVDGLAAETDEWSTTVRGTVSSTFDSDQENVQVTVVGRAPDGRIIGAEWTYVDRVPAGGTAAQFEAGFLEPMPADTVFEAYALL